MLKPKRLKISTILKLACLLLIFFPLQTWAQSVVLKLNNGDQLTGKIISETTNLLTFSTSWTKEIAIPLSEIKSRQILPAPVIAATTNSVTATNLVAATNSVASTNLVASTNSVAATNAVAAAAPATNAPAAAKPPVVVAAAKPPAKKPPAAWHGDAQIGADVGLGQTKRQLYYGRFKTTYAPSSDSGLNAKWNAVDRFRNIFDFNASYGTTDGILSANQMGGSSKTDFDLGAKRKVFVYNLLGAGYDEIRKIDFRYEVGPGFGYHALARSNLVLNAEFGMNYQVQYLKGAPSNERFYYRFAEDFTWRISKLTTFDEKFEFFPKTDLNNFRFRLESNLRYWLLENLSLNLTVIDIFDTQPAPNVGRNELQIRSSIGVKF